MSASDLITQVLTDPLMRDAALEAPNVMSGITDQIRAHVVDDYMEKTHGDELRGIEQAEEALELADVAVQVATGTVRAAGEFLNQTQFADFIASTLGDQRRANIEAGISQELAGALQQVAA